jgi:hypothetical protein
LTIYVNNLTRLAADNLEKAASTIQRYLGCLELDFACPVKFALSNMLIRTTTSQLKKRTGHSFEELGFKLKSVPGLHYSILLSYKIERPTSEELQQDFRFSLNSLSPAMLPLSSPEVNVEPAKLRYLKNAKAGSMRRARIEAISDTELASRIKEQILDNYIYKLGRSNNGETLKFNVILELEHKAKVQCSLEY